MPIDPSIPLQVQNPKFESPTNQLAMMSDAMKVGEMQRSVGVQNELRNLYSQGVDVNTPEGFKRLASIDPATAMKLREQGLTTEKLKGDIKKTGVEVDQKTYDLVKQRTSDLAFNPSNENIIAHLQDGVKRGEITPQQAEMTWKGVSALPLDKRKAYFTELGVKADARYQGDISKRGQDISASTAQRGQDLTDARAREGQRLQYDPTVQGNIAAARAGGTEYGKAGAQTNIALPGAIATGEDAIRKVDELVGALPVKNKEGKIITPGTKPAAGFEQAVGLGIPGLKYIPGSSAADFNARLNEVQGGAFLQAFNTLRGGGSITEKEGEKATAAINRMSTAQSEKEFNIAAREYQSVLRTGIERAKTKAATLSGGSVPSGRGGVAPATGGEIDFNSLR
jgi:hypothetical protein